MLNKYHLKIVAILLLFLILSAITLTLYSSTSEDKALSIVSNTDLSRQEQFLQMTSLAYQDDSDPKALFLLYNMLYHGQGTPASPNSAIIILEKSAKAGYVVAQEELGFIYLYGNEHYKKNIGLAHYWLKKAAHNGMKKSYNFLYTS